MEVELELVQVQVQLRRCCLLVSTGCVRLAAVNPDLKTILMLDRDIVGWCSVSHVSTLNNINDDAISPVRLFQVAQSSSFQIIAIILATTVTPPLAVTHP